MKADKSLEIIIFNIDLQIKLINERINKLLVSLDSLSNALFIESGRDSSSGKLLI